MKKIVCLCLAMMLLIACCSAFAEEKPIVIRLNIGASATETVAGGLEVFKAEVEKNSGGKMTVEIYYNNQLGDATQALAAVVKGNYEMCGSGATYIAEFMPELGVLNMGYLYKNAAHADAVLNGEIGQKLFERIADATGLLPLGAYYFGARNVMLTIDRAVSTPKDLADIKMRTNGTEPMMFLSQAMGANPVGIAYTEMYTALQTGTVDGQENPLSGAIGAKLYEVSKSVTYTRHYIDFSWIAIGKAFFEGLSPENQQIIRDAVKAGCDFNTAAGLKIEEEAGAFLEGQGLKVYDVDTSAIREQVLEAYQQKAIDDGWDMELFDEIQKVGENF